MVISLGWLSPATSRGLPAARTTRAGSRCLLGLAPTGGYRAAPVARRAVGSYPTFSPLPLDKGRSVFCGPFRRLAAPRRYLAVRPVEVGLSSARHSDRRTATITPYRLPRGKVSVSEGSGQASARQPSQQANQAVGRESSGSLRARRLPGKPEAVVLLEHHAFQARPVTGPQQRRRELDGVHAVQPPRPEQRQHVTRLGLGREQVERSGGSRRGSLRSNPGAITRVRCSAASRPSAWAAGANPPTHSAVSSTHGAGSASPRAPREESARGSRAAP